MKKPDCLTGKRVTLGVLVTIVQIIALSQGINGIALGAYMLFMGGLLGYHTPLLSKS